MSKTLFNICFVLCKREGLWDNSDAYQWKGKLIISPKIIWFQKDDFNIDLEEVRGFVQGSKIVTLFVIWDFQVFYL